MFQVNMTLEYIYFLSVTILLNIMRRTKFTLCLTKLGKFDV